MISKEFDQLLINELWLRVTGDEPWTVEQIEENKILEGACKDYLSGSREGLQFIEDEASDRGLDVEAFCQYVVLEGARYRKLVQALWRARNMLDRYIQAVGVVEVQDVAELIEQNIDSIISQYVEN